MTTITPPVAGNSLVALVGAATPVGYNGSGGLMVIDHVNDVAYFIEEGSPATGAAGIKRLLITNTGTELLQATETTLFGAGPAHTLGGNAQCWHPGLGKLFIGIDGSSNSSPIACIDGATLTTTYIAGISSSSLDPSVTGRYLLSFQMIPLTAGDDNYIVSRGLTGASHENEVGIFKDTGSTLDVVYAQAITEPLARLCTGDNGSDVSVASFYCLGDVFSRGSGSTTGVVFYEFLVHGSTIGQRTVRTINPADIDATWTKFDTVSEPGYDLADGNVLVFFSTQETVTNKSYLVKFSPADGSILWKQVMIDRTYLPDSSINGTLGVFHAPLAGNRTLDLINLASGAITTQSWNNGFTAITQAIWDYASGGLAGNLGYTHSGTGPTPNYLGSYLAANADVIPSNRWGRLFTAQTYVEPTPPDPPSGSAPQTSWSYFLDGHQFYVIDLGAQGTFLFDQLTDQWCKFVTTSTTPLWNMAVGAMWNSRVVGGDRTLNKVWELDPNAVLDNAADEITRVVTGMLQRRSRNYMGVGALRVVCSSGSLDGSGDGTITLRFSDDIEHTWSDDFTITLTAGDYSQEIAWRALGSFAAPGRVFEIRDVGGLVRIDSADLDPEKDQDEQPTS